MKGRKLLKKSWSGLKKELEKDLLCESLKGRVSYFLTSYRKSHDGVECRFAVTLDKKEVFRASSFINLKNRKSLTNSLLSELGLTWREAYNFADDSTNKQSLYFVRDVFSSILAYKKERIQNSVSSDDPLVKMFAVLDRRVGKRTLMKLKKEISYQPKWLQFFYKLRLEAENI